MEPLKSKPILKSATQVVRPYQNTLIEVVIVLVAAGLFYWYLLSPKAAEVKVAHQRLAQVEQEAATLTEKKAQLDALLKQLKLNEKDEIPKLNEALPLEPQISRLYLVIERYGQISGMTIGNISINTGPEAIVAGNVTIAQNPYGVQRTVRQLTANVTLSGTFEQFQAFLKNIETHPRIIDISSLDITGTQDNIIDFKFSLTTYYYE